MPSSVRSTPRALRSKSKIICRPATHGFRWARLLWTTSEFPTGYLRWRVSKPGVGEYIGAPITEDIHGFVREFNFPLDAAAAAPEGMVPVPAGQYFTIVWSLGDLGPYDLPAFYIDRFEVTNRQYQEFVDKGGYQKREYWKEKFLRTARN